MKETFRKIANRVSVATGSVGAFMLALTIVIIWAVTGPYFDYSNTWQLIINTGTTIGTFLMVFLIQNTQNRDGKAMQLKLDELIRASRANDTFIDIEDLSDDELATIADSFHKIHSETNDPTYKKFKSKLEVVMTKRHTMPGEEVASQVVNILNPFDNHEVKNRHKK
jgi:low affinity Fe/Cu permease